MIHILDYKTENIIATLENKENTPMFWNDDHVISLEENKETFDFTMQATVPAAEQVKNMNLVVIPDDDGYYREFIIENTYQYDNQKEVNCSASYVGLAKQKIISPYLLEGYTALTAAEYVLQGTEWKLGVTEFAGSRNVVWTEYTNALQALKDVAKVFELELRFRVEVSSNRITGRYVDLIQGVGEETGKEIVLGKDLIGVKRRETTDVYSALVGVGPEKENGTRSTVQVMDGDALIRWGKNGMHLWGVYQPDVNILSIDGVNILKGTKDFLSSYWTTPSKQVSTYDPAFQMSYINGVYPNVPYATMTQQGINFQNDVNYVVSAMFRANEAGKTVGVTLADDKVNYQPKAVNTVWTRISWTFVADQTMETLDFFRFESSNATPESPIEVCQIKIEVGTSATPWIAQSDERLEEVTRAELDKRINSTIKYEADAVSIESVFGLRHEAVRIGDRIRVKDTSYEPPLYLTARVIDLGRAISDKSRRRFVLGDFIEYTEDEVMRTFRALKVLLDKKASIIDSSVPPSDPYDGQLWLDTSGENDIWKRFDEATGTWKEGPGGKSAYFHTAYATNSTGTAGFSLTDPVGKTYIGTYSDYVEQASTDPALYTWVLIQGPEGPAGADGIDGTDGMVAMSQTEPSNPPLDATWFQTDATGNVIAVKKWTGSSWTTAKMDAQTLGVAQLSALTADLGTVTAGSITGVNINVDKVVRVGEKIYLQWEGGIGSTPKELIFNEDLVNTENNSKVYGTSLKTTMVGYNVDIDASNVIDVYAPTVTIGKYNGSVNLNGPTYLNYPVYTDEDIVRTDAETGYCGVGGMTASTTTGACAGVGVNFRNKKNYTPSSISLSSLSNNASPLTTQITADGFWLYLNGGGSDGIFRYWRGNYTA